MNRFGFCKQEGPVFRIRDLNSPWRSVLHLGQRQMVGKSYQWEDDPETSTFSFLEKGRVRLLNLSETGKERIVLYIEPGCLFREIVLLHVSPSHRCALRFAGTYLVQVFVAKPHYGSPYGDRDD